VKMLQVVLLGLAFAAVGGCSVGNDNDVDEDRGRYSVKVEILGVQDCGYVTHNLAGPDDRCYTGTCIGDFDKDLSIIVQAFDGGWCVFEGWGGDCAFANRSNECPLTVDRQYNITATFVAR
jgi:hypothetical protein